MSDALWAIAVAAMLATAASRVSGVRLGLRRAIAVGGAGVVTFGLVGVALDTESMELASVALMATSGLLAAMATAATRQLFEAYGYECHTAADEELTGAPDTKLFDVCRSEQRMLVTFDLGIGDVRVYRPRIMPGSCCCGSAISSRTRHCKRSAVSSRREISRPLEQRLAVVTEGSRASLRGLMVEALAEPSY